MAEGGRILEVVDFRCVDVDESTEELVVTGEVPYGGGEVTLEPHVYVTAPEYWGVDVVWDRTNAMLTVITPYEVRIPLTDVHGLRGVQLFGKRRTMLLDLWSSSEEESQTASEQFS